MALPRQTHSYLLPTPLETAGWGRSLGARLQAGDVIALIGDLGAGKTTLTQAIAKGMNIVEPVTSPTFALAQEYSGRVPLFHFDPYRLDSAEAFAEIGFEEYFERKGVIVVEWADKIPQLLPEELLVLRLSLVMAAETPTDEESTPRWLQAEAIGTRFADLLNDLQLQPDIAVLSRASE